MIPNFISLKIIYALLVEVIIFYIQVFKIEIGIFDLEKLDL